jgi:putative endopeptidase
MSHRFCMFILCVLIPAGFAQQPGSPATADTGGDHPITVLPYSPSLDVRWIDRSADPCIDFYQYSCGGWMRQNPIPPDQSSWSVYGKLTKENQQFLWGILDDLTRNATRKRTPAQQKIGDHFAACMDEATVERLGAQPLKPVLDQIAAVKNVRELAPLVARMQLATLNFYYGNIIFGFSSSQDYADSSQVIAFASAGGLGLPDRDYYTRTDGKSENLRRQYLAHMRRMFQLLGDVPDAADREAKSVLAIETALAKASWTLVQKREPHNLFHKMGRTELQALTPSFDWPGFLTASGLPDVRTFNITEPEFFKALEAQFKSAPLADWKNYLRWQWTHRKAQYLSSAFVNEDFDFFSRTLRGTPQLRPRWRRCVFLVDRQLGDALGQEFISRTFSPDMKSRALQMTEQIERAMEQDIQQLDWMGPSTREQALAKLHRIVNKIGYPDKWRDYSPLDIVRGDFSGNVDRANTFESRRWLNKIGKPVDHTEWDITPPTVNAYYDAQLNDINFPAGVLQPPLYDTRIDEAPNFGNTGSTIGHELTHGFDDEGRQFDANGNLRDWWTKEDAANFEKRAQCVVDQYAQYVIVDDIHINSKLTEGEDVADIGGTLLAWMAWKTAEAGKKNPGNREGFTSEQRFFIGFAQWACEDQRPENLRVNAITNPHSPGKYRINGVVGNMPEFQQAFRCKTGQPMAPEKRCRVW